VKVLESRTHESASNARAGLNHRITAYNHGARRKGRKKVTRAKDVFEGLSKSAARQDTTKTKQDKTSNDSDNERRVKQGLKERT
jgi:hypothetical protein